MYLTSGAKVRTSRSRSGSDRSCGGTPSRARACPRTTIQRARAGSRWRVSCSLLLEEVRDRTCGSRIGSPDPGTLERLDGRPSTPPHFCEDRADLLRNFRGRPPMMRDASARPSHSMPPKGSPAAPWPSASSAVPPPTAGRSAAADRERALAAERLAGYRALWPPRPPRSLIVHARYEARRRPARAGLQGPAREPRRSPSAAPPSRRAVDALEAEPREPVLLNYAGVLLLRARAPSRRRRGALPRRPAPGPDARRRRAQPRASASAAARGRRPSLAGEVAAPGPRPRPRAERIAAAARPAEGLTSASA